MNGKKDKLVLLMCIGLITTISIPLGTAEYSKNPFATTNIDETVYCDTCHAEEMPDVFVSLTVDSQTTSDITYAVSGSDIYDGEEGWAVFDSLENNIKNGLNAGTFTLPKNGYNYRVYWVDNGTGGGGPEGGGSAYENFQTPNDPPSDPTITGKTDGTAGESYTYTFVSTDDQEHDIFYYIEWGDGNTADWDGPHASGAEYKKAHTFEKGTWTIKAKARDEYGAESGWGELKVTMPKAKSFVYSFNILNWLFEHFPNLVPILKYLI